MRAEEAKAKRDRDQVDEMNETKNSPQKKVLYVDSYEDNRFVMEYLLRDFDYDCIGVTTVAEGLQLAKYGRFDLYLLDTWCCDGSGIELCSEIRKFDADTPILFFSAWTPTTTRDQALAAGANAYLLKPCIDEVLVEIRLRLAMANSSAEYPPVLSLALTSASECHLRH